ncbi:hypothetical protein FP435_03785 [Lactobacillus sp. PV037]|nr:hypothetical protein FP433_04045 [Lactobacillus sp. PV012]QNQ83623.1 hypothetical protein FP435_03785 [Lactobacillus sp. PV037]
MALLRYSSSLLLVLLSHYNTSIIAKSKNLYLNLINSTVYIYSVDFATGILILSIAAINFAKAYRIIKKANHKD